MAAYFDHAATTPMFREAIEAMMPFLAEHDANPSSPHAAGRFARRAIDDARDQLSGFLDCEPGEIVFTSGGTEADDLAILGAGATSCVVVSAIEHSAVLEPAALLGARVVRVTPDGVLDLDHLRELLDPTIGLVSVMAANNEVGTVQPLAHVARLAAELAPAALLHCDAVQAAPWCDLGALCADFDLVSVSAHKFGGPKGVGALVVRARARPRIRPLLLGGSQEGGVRAGTENVAGIVAAGCAAAVWMREKATIVERVQLLRDRLEDGLLAAGASANAPRALRICSIAPVHFSRVKTEEVLMALDRDGVAASAGAACASGALEPSHVLAAMGRSRDEIEGSIRLSLGWTTTSEEVDTALRVIPDAVRSLSRS